MKNLVTVLLVIWIFQSLGQSKINGNWSVLSSDGDYSELFFEQQKVKIYSEVGGYIGCWDFSIKQDSLYTKTLNYNMNWLNRNSLVLSSNVSTLYLKRIKIGFQLNEYSNESLEQKYVDSFYTRMYKRKGIIRDSLYRSVPKSPRIREEVIETKRR